MAASMEPVKIKEIETSKINLDTKFPLTWEFIEWKNISSKKEEYAHQLFYRTNTRKGCGIFTDKTIDQFKKLLESEEELFFLVIDHTILDGNELGVIGIIWCKSLDKKNINIDLYEYNSKLYYVIFTKWSCSLTTQHITDPAKDRKMKEMGINVEMQHIEYTKIEKHYGEIKKSIDLKEAPKLIDVKLSVGKFLKVELIKWMIKNVPVSPITNIMTIGWSINHERNISNDGILNSERQLENLINIETGVSIEKIYENAWDEDVYIFWNISIEKNAESVSAAKQKYLYYKNKYLSLKKLFIE
jgi:hypothetical protein